MEQTDDHIQALVNGDIGCNGDYSKPGDAGHSVFHPQAGDFRGDSNVQDGSFLNDPLKWIKDAGQRLVSYGNWAGPDNKYVDDMKQKWKDDPNYDPAKDDKYGKDGKKTSVDALDDAARVHDLEYYNAIGHPGDPNEKSMFGIDGLIATHDADRRLQKAAESEMDHASDWNGKKVNYSDDTRNYAAGMEGYFGGRADGVEIRQKLMNGEEGVGDALGEAGSDIAAAYKKNGALGAVGEGLGLANVAVAQAVKSGGELVTNVENTVSNGVNTVADAGKSLYHWLAD
jgi:hypothetical protein